MLISSPLQSVALGIGALSAFCLSASVLAQEEVRLPTADRFLTEQSALEYSIGSDRGEHWETLFGVRDVAFSAADELFVLDSGNRRVLQFDRQGRFVRQIGREGQGPGEFGLPTAVEVTRQGLVVVSDERQGIVVFDSSGRHVRTVRQRETTGSAAVGLNVGPDGEVFWLGSRPATDRTDWFVYRHTLQMGDDPTVLGRFAVDPLSSVMTSTGFSVRRNAQYSVRPSLAVLPNGSLVVLKEEDYVVSVLDGMGQPIRQLVGSIRARRVTERDKEAWYERVEGRDPRSLPTVEYEMPFADRMSVLTGVRTDPTGRIWVRRRRADGGENGPIDLLTEDGRYIGTLLNQALPAAVSATNLAAYVQRDELGVERVVVRRLPQSWR